MRPMFLIFRGDPGDDRAACRLARGEALIHAAGRVIAWSGELDSAAHLRARLDTDEDLSRPRFLDLELEGTGRRFHGGLKWLRRHLNSREGEDPAPDSGGRVGEPLGQGVDPDRGPEARSGDSDVARLEAQVRELLRKREEIRRERGRYSARLGAIGTDLREIHRRLMQVAQNAGVG